MTDIVSGGFVAGLISLCANGFKVLGDSMSFWIPVGSKGITQIPLGFSTASLGAGYLIGIASGIAILVGVLIAWAGFVPYFTNMFAPDGGATAKFAMAIWKSKSSFHRCWCYWYCCDLDFDYLNQTYHRRYENFC